MPPAIRTRRNYTGEMPPQPKSPIPRQEGERASATAATAGTNTPASSNPIDGANALLREHRRHRHLCMEAERESVTIS